jgi:hypothetical protein
MHDQAEMARPHLLRNGDFQHRRNDQIRRLAGDSGNHCLVRRRATDADFVATLAELDPQTLAEAVVGRGQKENSHGFSPLFSAGRHEPESVFSRAEGEAAAKGKAQNRLLRAPSSGGAPPQALF